MNEQDKQAFVAWKIEQFKKEEPRLVPSEAWQAALEYARGQQEPVACIGTNGELMWLNKPDALYSKAVPLYTHPAQPVQPAVNEQLLGFIKEWLSRQGNDDNYMVAKARSTIAAAEAAKGGV